MRQQGATGDLAIARIAARQHGVVSFRQLQAAGLSGGAVARRVHAGRLHRIHRGVYAVGHAGPSNERRWMAAALAYGNGAVVSHRSAAALWGLLTPRSEAVHISIPGLANKGKHKGIRLHRSRTLTPDHATRRRGIPVTTPMRTIEDLRRIAPESEVRRAIRQAGVLGFLLEGETPPDPTRSELERCFLHLCERHGLPRPEVNVKVESIEVDFLWRDQHLIVETDGYKYHRGRVAFENDRDRDLRLRAFGYAVVRLGYRQVVDEPKRVAGVLKPLLVTAAHPPGSA